MFYIIFNIHSIETNWYVNCLTLGVLQLERFTAEVSLKHRTLNRGTVKATQVKWENARDDDRTVLWWGQTLLTQIALATAAKKATALGFSFPWLCDVWFLAPYSSTIKTLPKLLLTPLPSQNSSAVQKTPKLFQQLYSESNSLSWISCIWPVSNHDTWSLAPFLLPAESFTTICFFLSIFVIKVGEGISRNRDSTKGDGPGAITSFSTSVFSVNYLSWVNFQGLKGGKLHNLPTAESG